MFIGVFIFILAGELMAKDFSRKFYASARWKKIIYFSKDIVLGWSSI